MECMSADIDSGIDILCLWVFRYVCLELQSMSESVLAAMSADIDSFSSMTDRM